MSDCVQVEVWVMLGVMVEVKVGVGVEVEVWVGVGVLELVRVMLELGV